MKPRTLSELDSDEATLTAYLLQCVRQCDWHGASDAANDLRELVVERECVVAMTPTMIMARGRPS